MVPYCNEANQDRRAHLTRGRSLLLLAGLALIAYAPALNIPLIEDDYPNIAQAVSYGPVSGLKELLGDAVFRLRATSYWAMFYTWHFFGLSPVACHALSLIIHFLNTILLYLCLTARPSTREAGFWAAAFFAVHEGHQEAVMWFSAINELFVFLFFAAAVFFWRVLPGGRWWQDWCGVVTFGLALLSKESAVMLLPAVWVVARELPLRRRMPIMIICSVATALTLASVYGARYTSFRFSDGSFALSAPFWITWPRGVVRLLWFWGWIALAAVAWFRERQGWRMAAWALLVAGAALIPYSFLTYSTQIPSRQTYAASAGLAMLVGLATARAMKENQRLALLVFTLAMVHNCAYLWTKKHAQFVERAAPTEQLIAAVRRTQSPVWIKCFPRSAIIAEEAVRLAAGVPGTRLVWDEPEANRRNAIRFEYVDASGNCRPPSGR